VWEGGGNGKIVSIIVSATAGEKDGGEKGALDPKEKWGFKMIDRGKSFRKG